MKCCKLELFGEILMEGFWLYVIDVQFFGEREFLYVGHAGYADTGEGGSPWDRMIDHVSRGPLRTHIENRGLKFEQSFIKVAAFGPLKIVPQEILGTEKALAQALRDRGYDVAGNHKGTVAHNSDIIKEIIKELSKGLLRRRRD